MVRIKVCGITNLKDARAAVDAGCDALGFVFYRKSPRYIAPSKARAITRGLPRRIVKIGVFVNAQEKNIKNIARACGLNMLQFHGDESPEFCAKFGGYRVIKAFRVKDNIDFKKILRYKTFAWLFDTFAKSKVGGTGRRFNWRMLDSLSAIRRPVFLSGGLNAKNVLRGIKVTHPDWIDVSSSVEIRPGIKDTQKLNNFIKIVRKA